MKALEAAKSRALADNLATSAYSLRHNRKRSAPLADETIQLARAVGNRDAEALGLITKAEHDLRVGNLEKAKWRAEQAKSLLEALLKPTSLADNLLGQVYLKEGNVKEALRTFLQVYEQANARQDKYRAADALHHTADVYLYLSDYPSTIDCQFKSLTLAKEVNYRVGIERANTSLAHGYLELAKPVEALNVLRELSERNPLIIAYRGKAHYLLEQYPQALSYLERALPIIADEDPLSLPDTLILVGETEAALGNPHACYHYLNRAESLVEEYNSEVGRAKVELAQGNFFLKYGDHVTGAIYILLTALSRAESLKNMKLIYTLHDALADAYEVLKRHDQALHHVRRFYEVRGQVRSAQDENRIHALEIAHDVAAKEKERQLTQAKNDELSAANAELERLTRELREKSVRDMLTKLYNRRYFDEAANKAFDTAQRAKQPLSILISDIDNFKKVNDTFGHAIGDKVLVIVAQILTDAIRAGDTVARYGGEEFVGLFPNSSAQEAAQVCQRMRIAVAEYPWNDVASGLQVTLSMGLCDDLTLPNAEKIVTKADDFLYHSKHNGKNQLTLGIPETSPKN